jgi:hypothetical protein
MAWIAHAGDRAVVGRGRRYRISSWWKEKDWEPIDPQRTVVFDSSSDITSTVDPILCGHD